MSEAFNSFIEIVKACAPYSLAWALGVRAYRFVVDCFTGKDADV